MSAPAGSENDVDLPTLREDLQLVAAASEADGWLIVDPVKHGYFRVSKAMFEVLSVWKSGSISALQAQFIKRFSKPADKMQIEEVANFLLVNELTIEPKEGGWRYYAGLAQKRQKSLLAKGLHSYLFFRIPLMRPQKILDLAWPFVGWAYTRIFALVTLFLAIVSLWLVSRQWDVFMATFSSFLTPKGALTYGAILVFVKVFHEFGHAFMAKKYGSPVPTLGAAFIVLFPILYTDTTAAWRLERRKRLMVDAGGIFAELTLAVFATTLWVFLPDGNARALAFVVATISWIMSLAVNLNPLMRFDGYYLLSDGLGVENLQARGFAMARWRMREALFGWQAPPPEQMPKRLRQGLILHAYATWIYRFFLFLGIALIVYHMFFKLAGNALFVVEIVWFIGLPIWRELKEWGGHMPEQKLNWPVIRTGIVAISILLLLFVPWQRSIAVPATYSAGQVTQLFPLGSGQITSLGMVESAPVKKGAPLVTIRNEALEASILRLNEQIELLELRIARAGADTQDRSFRTVLESQLQSRREEAASLFAQRDELALLAPSDGKIANILADLSIGHYVSGETPLGIFIHDERGAVTAYLPSHLVERVAEGAQASFIPEEPEHSKTALVVADIALPSDGDRMMRSQFDIYGGAIVATPDPDTGALRASEPHYQVKFSARDALPVPRHEMRGTVHIEAKPQSLGSRILRQIAGVLIRESGF